MLIVFMSLSGNVDKFVSFLDMDSVEIDFNDSQVEVDRDYIAIVPTYDDSITDVFSSFIDYKDNKKHLKGFVGSGSKNFDADYIFNAKDLSKKYNKPLIFDFEFSGDNDVLAFKEEVEKIEVTRTK